MVNDLIDSSVELFRAVETDSERPDEGNLGRVVKAPQVSATKN